MCNLIKTCNNIEYRILSNEINLSGLESNKPKMAKIATEQKKKKITFQTKIEDILLKFTALTCEYILCRIFL